MERLVHCLCFGFCVIENSNSYFFFFLQFCEPNAVLLFSRYKILEELGDGTCGSVYKAWDKQTGEIVSISLQVNII